MNPHAIFRAPNLSGKWTILLLAAGFMLAGCNGDSTSPTPPDTIPPSAVTHLVSTIQPDGVYLQWENPDDADFAGVVIRRGETTAPTDSTGVFLFDGDTRSYADLTITPGVDYIYAIFAYDDAGNMATPTFLPVVTVAPIPVHFNDPDLEQVMRLQLGVPLGDILATDMLAPTELVLTNDNIDDLEGIQYCLNLGRLILDLNQLQDTSHLELLRNLTRLWELNLQDNQIHTIPDLTGLNSLRNLYLSGNDITSLAPVAHLPALEKLEVTGSDLADLSPLAGLLNLTSVMVFDSAVSDLHPLANLPLLGTLDFSNDRISDLTPLTGLEHLTYIALAGNPLHDVQALVDNTYLGADTAIYLNDTPLLHDAVATQIPTLTARGVDVYLDDGLPVDPVGIWTVAGVTVNGEVTDPAVFFDWEPGATTNRLFLYYNNTYEVEDLNDSQTVLYDETGTADLADGNLTLTELTENGVPVSDGSSLTGTWRMVDDQLEITTIDEGDTAIVTWSRLPEAGG